MPSKLTLIFAVLLAAVGGTVQAAPDHRDLEACRAAAAARDKEAAATSAERARAALSGYIESHPQDAEGHFAYAQVVVQCQIPFAQMLRRAGLANEAERHLRSALEITPEHLDARLLYGTLLYHLPPFLGRTQDAIAQLQLVVEATERGEKGSPNAYLHLGELLKRAGRDGEAEQIWNRGAERFPDHEGLRERAHAPPSAPVPADPALDRDVAVPSAAAALAALVERELSSPGGVGLSVAVAVGGKTLLLDGFGTADLEHRAPATAETVYRIGSVTKQFLAAAALRQTEAGELALNDSLTRWLPELAEADDKITLHHLLSHTSGLPRDVVEEGEGSWIERSLAAERVGAPGERYLYSNFGYTLVGVLLERLTGGPIGEVFEDSLMKPLQLRNTRPCDPRAIVPHRAQGYQIEGDRILNDEPLTPSPSWFYAGGLCSTAGDLLRWQQALRSGEVVSPEQYRQMRTPATVTDPKGTTYGYGLHARSQDGRPVVHHGGGVTGFLTELAYYPNEQIDIVVLANSEGANPRRFAQTLVAAISSAAGQRSVR